MATDPHRSPMSPASSHTDSFSMLEAISRSRSSTQSYQTVATGTGLESSTFSFSELSAALQDSPTRILPPLRNPEPVDDDEFVLIPPGSTLLSPGRRSASSTMNLATLSPEPGIRQATPLGGITSILQRHSSSDGAQADVEDDDSDTTTSESSSESDEEEEEGDARASQRRMRSWAEDVAEEEENGSNGTGAEDQAQSEDDDIVLSRGIAATPLPTRSRRQYTTPTPDRSITFVHETPQTPVQAPCLTSTAASPLQLLDPVQVNESQSTCPNVPSSKNDDRKALRSARRRAKVLRRRERERQAKQAAATSSQQARPANGDETFAAQQYDEAVTYVTAYLKDPPENPSQSVRLHFLQSVIIELGLLSQTGLTLPTSIAQATRLIKDHVFLNIKTYLNARTKSVPIQVGGGPQLTKSQRERARQKARALGLPPPANAIPSAVEQVGVGAAELQKLLFPSRNALVQSLRGKKKPVPREVIKRLGLTPFMVTTFR